MRTSIRPVHAALVAFYLFLLILTGLLLIRRVHTPIPQQSGAPQNDRFIFDNAGLLDPNLTERLEQKSEALYREERVRVLVVTAGIQTDQEAILERNSVVNRAKIGSLIDQRVELYPPAIVVYVCKSPNGSPVISKEWTGNFWYAHWDQLEPVSYSTSTSDYVGRYTSNVYSRAHQQTVLHSWRRRFASHGVVVAFILFFLGLTFYWLEGLAIRVWDGRSKPFWVLPAECLIAFLILLSSFKAFMFFAGWPELDNWYDKLLILSVAVPLSLLLLEATRHLLISKLGILTSLLVAAAVVFQLVQRGAISNSGVAFLVHAASSIVAWFALLCFFLLLGRLWLSYMGEQSSGFVGDLTVRIQAFDRYLVPTGKSQAEREPENLSISLRRLISESSIANVYWIWSTYLGIYVGLICHMISPQARAISFLRRAEACRNTRHPLAKYHYLPQARRFISEGKLFEARAATLHALELLRSLTPHWPNVVRSGDFLGCQEALGEVAQLQGDPEEARKLLFEAWPAVEQEVVQGDISPWGIKTRMRLGRYYQELGNRVRAAKYFEEALQCLDFLRNNFISDGSLPSLRDITRRLRLEHLTAMAEGMGGPISAATEVRPFLRQLRAYESEAAYSLALCLEPEREDPLSSTPRAQKERVAQLRTRALATNNDPLSLFSILHSLLSEGPASEKTPFDLYQDPVQDNLWAAAPTDVANEWNRRNHQDRALRSPSRDLEASVTAWIARNEGVRLMSEDKSTSQAMLLFALEHYRRLGKADGLADVYLCLAEYGLNSGQRLSAEKLGRMSLDLADKMGHTDLQRQAHLLLARVYRESGLWTKARAQADQAINLVEEVRQRVPNPDVRALFTSSRIDAYAEQVMILLSMRQPAQALEYVERSKSRALVELLGNHKIRVRDAADEVLIRQDEELQRALAGLNYQLRSREATVDEDADAEDTEIERGVRRESRQQADQDRQTDLRQQLAIVKQQIRDNAQEWTTLKVVQMLPFDDVSQPDDIRRQLHRQFSGSGERVVALEFYVMDEKTLVFGVPCWEGEETLFVVETDLSRAGIDKLTHEDFQDTILSPPKDADGRPEPLFLETLYTHLFARVAPQIQQMAATMLLFVPHAGLHALPLHAVYHRDEQGKRRYLIEDYPCAYVPSLSVLGHLKQPRAYTHKDTALVMGNPLPVEEAGDRNSDNGSDLVNAEFEAEDIAALLGAEPILGRQATEAILLAEAEKHQIIHLACHADFDPQDALQSHLVMADGLLQVDEVLDLNLKASLVTLSACRSGVSAVSAGDELVGMTRAWLYAGSPSVVASQWNVSDEVSWGLMVSFYRHWTKGGQSKARALQSAQLEVLKQRRRPRGQEIDPAAWDPACSPAVWAPFILVGNPL